MMWWTQKGRYIHEDKAPLASTAESSKSFLGLPDGYAIFVANETTPYLQLIFALLFHLEKDEKFFDNPLKPL